MEKKLIIKKELTPIESCIGGMGCPAIFETNQNSYVIIGKKINAKELGISNRLGKNEVLIEVQKNLIDKKK